MTTPARVAMVLAQSEGGIGRHLAKLAGEVLRRGGEVLVFGPPDVREFAFEDLGATFIPVEITAGIDPVGTLRAARTLRGRLAGVDIVHGHGIRAGIAASLAARRQGVIHRVVTVHNAIVDRRGVRWGAAAIADRVLPRLATRLICVSDDLAATFRKAAPRRGSKILVMPVGAEMPTPSADEISAVRASLGTSDERPLVVAVGRLHRQKGFDVLIEASMRLSHIPVPLVAIAGEGPGRAHLEVLIEKLPVPERVRLLGSRDDAGALAAAADVFCMPSRWEGSPLALHEAMLLGRPIVASRTGGIPSMLGEESALLVPPEDPAALAKAIDLLMRDGALARRLGEAAAKAGAAWPDAGDSAASVADLYEALLGRALGTA